MYEPDVAIGRSHRQRTVRVVQGGGWDTGMGGPTGSATGRPSRSEQLHLWLRHPRAVGCPPGRRMLGTPGSGWVDPAAATRQPLRIAARLRWWTGWRRPNSRLSSRWRRPG